MQKQKGISTLVGVIIIIVAIAILFGGVFAYQHFAVKTSKQLLGDQQDQNQQQQTVNQQANNVQPINQTAGWKTYQNDTYGFGFQYPANLTLSGSDGGNGTLSVYLYPNNDSISNKIFGVLVAQTISKDITDIKSNLELNNQLLAKVKPGITFKVTQTVIGGIPAISNEFCYQGNCELTISVPDYTKKSVNGSQTFVRLYLISVWSEKNVDFTKMLSTFKFTE